MSVPLPAHLSPSGWTLFEQCQRAWRFRYVDGLKDPPTLATEVGTFAHLVLERVMANPSEFRSLDNARTLAGQTWDASGEFDRTVAPDATFKRLAWYAISGLWELEHPERVAVEATEQRIEWTEGDVPMVAIVDRVERTSAATLYVSDYKTSAEYKPKYVAPYKRQIAVGALGVRQWLGEPIAPNGKLLYVAAGHVEPCPTDNATLAATSEAAQQAWAGITEACATEDFPPTTSPLCSWCAHVARCPEGQSQVRRSLYFRTPPPADAPGVVALAALEAA